MDTEVDEVTDALRNLVRVCEQEMNCSLCLYVANDPISLPCNHFYCRECIAGLLKQSNATCPNCRAKFNRRNMIEDSSVRTITRVYRKLHKLVQPFFDLESLTQPELSQSLLDNMGTHVPADSSSSDDGSTDDEPSDEESSVDEDGDVNMTDDHKGLTAMKNTVTDNVVITSQTMSGAMTANGSPQVRSKRHRRALDKKVPAIEESAITKQPVVDLVEDVDRKKVCDVCMQDSDSNNLSAALLSCEECNAVVHAACYGVKQRISRKSKKKQWGWLCDSCSASRVDGCSDEEDEVKDLAVHAKECVLCCKADSKDSTLREMRGGEWVHVSCYLWLGAPTTALALMHSPLPTNYTTGAAKGWCSYCTGEETLKEKKTTNVASSHHATHTGLVKCLFDGCDKVYHVPCGKRSDCMFRIVDIDKETCHNELSFLSQLMSSPSQAHASFSYQTFCPEHASVVPSLALARTSVANTSSLSSLWADPLGGQQLTTYSSSNKTTPPSARHIQATGSGKKEKEVRKKISKNVTFDFADDEEEVRGASVVVPSRRLETSASSSSSSSSAFKKADKKAKNVQDTFAYDEESQVPKSKPAARRKRVPTKKVLISPVVTHTMGGRRRTSRQAAANKTYVLAGTGLQSTEFDVMVDVMKNIREEKKIPVSVVREWTPEVTHLIVATDDDHRVAKRSMKYFKAILSGLYIVSYEWIIQTMMTGEIPDEAEYFCQGDNVADGGALRARRILRVITSAGDRLFENFYFVIPPPPAYADENQRLKHEEVQELIALGGGVIAHTDEVKNENLTVHARNYYVCMDEHEKQEWMEKHPPDSFVKKIIAIDMTQVLECISQYDANVLS